MAKEDFLNLVEEFMNIGFDHPRYLIMHHDNLKKHIYILKRLK
jgi:hypothetical protein